MGGERFLTEIKTTAHLQHPHILPLFDSGEADGFLFYVMPFVEGESLRNRLNRERQLPVDEAVSIARAVAGALDYAHRHDVVHRDIKPENVLIHDGEPMVADFGIALAISAAGGGRLTETGLSLGTPHYMSPEQASADRDVSPRSDIYSLGCVLYEMLTGDPPHTGPTSHVILMRILTEAPRSVTDIRKSVPLHVASAVFRALEKLPADRFHSAEGFREALADETFRHTPPTGVQVPVGYPRAPGARVPFQALIRDFRVIAIAAIAVVCAALWIWAMSSGPSGTADEPIMKFPTPLGLGLGGGTGVRLAISPAGDRIAWLQRDEGGGYRLLTRPLHALVAQEVPGGANANHPFFSPDGAWLGFVTRDGDLVKWSLAGGQPLTIASGAPFEGPHWSDTGIIVFRWSNSGIYSVPDVGGEPRLLLRDPAASWVETLPGGKAIVFTHRSEEISEIRIYDTESGEVRTPVADGTDPHYVETGYLVYGRLGQTLFAVPFDLESLAVTGDPVPVLEPVAVYSAGATQFAVARNGTAVYVPSTGASEPETELVELGTDGSEQVLLFEPGNLSDPRYAPDGVRVAYDRYEGTWYLHVFSTLTGSNIQVSGEYSGFYPIWSTDGSTITFSGQGHGTDGVDVLRVPADGGAPPEILFTRPKYNYPQGWLADGRLLVRETHPGRGADLLIYRLEGDSVVETPYLTADWGERAASISPDGNWVAYSSNESGREEVYVRTFPQPSDKIPISESGGTEPRWSPNGRILYYREGTALVAADLGPGPGIQVRGKTTLFQGSDHFLWPQYAQYDVHPDGNRFLVVRNRETSGGEEVPEEMVVVVNWFRELEERMRSAGGG
jgi:Tol biopolymer transport system component